MTYTYLSEVAMNGAPAGTPHKPVQYSRPGLVITELHAILGAFGGGGTPRRAEQMSLDTPNFYLGSKL